MRINGEITAPRVRLVGDNIDQAFLAEPVDRIPHRRAGDADLHGNPGFGVDLIEGKGPVQNPALNIFVCLQLQGVECMSYHGSNSLPVCFFCIWQLFPLLKTVTVFLRILHTFCHVNQK